MKKLSYLILCILVSTFANANANQYAADSSQQGIKFVNGLTWKQVLKKAKKENKYIFIDCFTTWCGPCKLMEKEVFSKKEVGEFYNKNFLSVRSQMDRTAKDDEAIKMWYKDAEWIMSEYGIPAFPTYLFFSPDGRLISRDDGYKRQEDMILLGKNAINPNGDHRFTKYYSLLAKYQMGKKDFKVMPALIDTARLLYQDSLLNDLVRDYGAYLNTLSDEQLFTKEHIKVIASITQSSKDKFFRLFYPHGGRADSAMGQKGFANLLVDKIIFDEDIYPFLVAEKEAHKNDIPLLVAEDYPDWRKCLKKITDKYDADFATRNVLKAQVRWYKNNKEFTQCAKYFTLLVTFYSQDNYDHEMDMEVNMVCWEAIFKRSSDKAEIEAAIECMQGAVERQIARGLFAGLYLDTQANLLYKAGRVKEAIEKQQEAIEHAIKGHQSQRAIKDLQDTQEKMKKGEPTWPRYIDKNDFFGMGIM